MIFYRYVIQRYASFNGDDYHTYHNTVLKLEEYFLYKETPKGYWICYGNPPIFHSNPKWIPKTSKKRFAYPTKKEALNNFILRTKKELIFLKIL